MPRGSERRKGKGELGIQKQKGAKRNGRVVRCCCSRGMGVYDTSFTRNTLILRESNSLEGYEKVVAVKSSPHEC